MHKSLRALREGRRTPGPGGAAAAAAAAARYAGSARTINYLLIPSKKPVQVRPSGHTDAEPRPARCTRTHPHGRPRGRCFIDTYDGTLSGRSCFKPQRDLTEKRARARACTHAQSAPSAAPTVPREFRRSGRVPLLLSAVPDFIRSSVAANPRNPPLPPSRSAGRDRRAT